MSKHHAHINSAKKAIETLSPGEPVAHHLKRFFAADKKYGSKDRKIISSLCYNYYRAGHAFPEKTIEEKILNAYFLCAAEKNVLLEKLSPELNEKAGWPAEKKCSFLNIGPDKIFPFGALLSDEINKEAFALSFLRQPLLFLRLRPGKAVKILEKLTEAKADFEEINTSCISMPPASKAQDFFKINKDAVVQDMNSQQVFDYFNEDHIFHSKEVSVWDCCAASGGKSILLYDMLHGHIDLHVSDMRENILHNLRNRFKDAGIKKYHAFVADLVDENKKLPKKKYELIVCDAPCTGSGTWSRNPEQLHFFDEKKTEEYAAKQKKIAAAVIPHLQPGGLFFYITCSVFKKENEEVVQYIKEKCGLHLLQAIYLKGYADRADTLFTAVFSA
jgi:16S rRNA (cytosine967-C5)-methyltransferase